MGDFRRRSTVGASTVVAGLVLWAVAMVYSYFRPSLWLLDLIVVPLMWAFWIGGAALMAVGAVRVIGDRGRSPRVIAATAISALVVVLVSATVGIWWQVSPRGWFTTHRALYEQALDTDPGADYYGAYLPVHLRFLAAGGRMSGAPGDARFFPQWLGVPDDAGGYWHSPGRPPEGLDMYGMICTDPIDLGGDWWMCGLRD